MASFTELEVWKQARSIRKTIKELTNSFPADEKFRLADQVIRSSRSVGNNIAEGHGRFHYQDNIRFCIIARGSLSETLDHLIIAYDEHLLSKEDFKQLKGNIDLYTMKLNAYINHLKLKRDKLANKLINNSTI
jgi:four helix bundle protein